MRSLEHLEAPVPVHLAQAKCYAYIYAVQNSLKCIDVQMTYCQMETEEIRRFCQEFEFQELQTWFQDLVTQYEKWAKFEIEWRNVRNDSIRQIEFPFPYREGQRDLVVSVYRTILRKKKLFIQAPTGVGKTMATVFPAVRAVGKGWEKRFLSDSEDDYEDSCRAGIFLLKEKGLLYKTITLTAKEKSVFVRRQSAIRMPVLMQKDILTE